jgi:peptide/nickel transport system ATP-binding protein
MAAPLLELENLIVHFKTHRGWVHAVDNVSFTIGKGETLGLVGESGCGKTTTAFSILQILPYNAHVKGGDVRLKGRSILRDSVKEDGTIDPFNENIRKVRWKEISMIFQGAMNAFNPVYKVGDQIAEAIRVHYPDMSEQEIWKRIEELYDLVGIPKDRIMNYPHEYSGGMKQRAIIAMALALNPSLIIADEPTTALDVITQDRILGEMKRIQEETKTAMLLITHDVSVVAELSDKMAVMYAGQIVEMGTTRQIFKETAHPYTEALLGAFPSIKGDKKKRLKAIPGSPPDLISPPRGCRFHPRCPYARERCLEDEPELIKVGDGHYSRCHYTEELFGAGQGGGA